MCMWELVWLCAWIASGLCTGQVFLWQPPQDDSLEAITSKAIRKQGWMFWIPIVALMVMLIGLLGLVFCPICMIIAGGPKPPPKLW